MTRPLLSRRHRASLLAALCALAGACGPKVVPSSIIEEDDPRAGLALARDDRDDQAPDDATGGEPAAPEPGVAAPSPVAARPVAAPGSAARTGIIDRGELVRVLDAGPGALLRGLELSPFFEGTRFAGWRIDQIVDRGSPIARADLAAGDVVRTVNGQMLARPEHVMAVWQALRTAPELRCEVWRGAAQLSLRFAIEPPARPAPTATATTPPPARPPAAPAP